MFENFLRINSKNFSDFEQNSNRIAEEKHDYHHHIKEKTLSKDEKDIKNIDDAQKEIRRLKKEIQL